MIFKPPWELHQELVFKWEPTAMTLSSPAQRQCGCWFALAVHLGNQRGPLKQSTPRTSGFGQNWNSRDKDCCPSCFLLLKWEWWLNFVWGGRPGMQPYTEEVPKWTATLFLLLSDSFLLFLPSPPCCLGLFHMWHNKFFVCKILMCHKTGYEAKNYLCTKNRGIIR